MRPLLLVVALLAAAGIAPAAAVAQRDVPVLRAPSAILVEAATGDVVLAKKAMDRRPIASTTKIMTALLAFEALALDDVLVQTAYRAAPVESVAGFRGGERVTVRDMLRALLLASANDAASTFAVRIAGSRAKFVARMNERARELGLDDTRYANPVGLDDGGGYSSAADLVKLALVLRSKPFLRETVDLPRVTIRSGARPRTFVNRNTLVRTVPIVDGVKTGRTQGASYVLVGSATRRGVNVVSAVLGAPTEAARNADTLSLLRYGLGRYRRTRVVTAGKRLALAGLAYRDGSVRLVAEKTVTRTARRDEEVTARLEDVPRELDGPLPKGARVGTIIVRQRGRTVDRVALVTAVAVAEASTTDRLKNFFGRTQTVLLLAAFALGSLQLVVLRRRTLRRRGGRPREGETGLA